MSKKKVVKKEDRKEDAKNNIVKIFVEQYEYIELQESKNKEALSPLFRKIANEMYLAVKVNKVWKSSRALAKSMNKDHVVITRYVNAGEWLSRHSDEQLKKVGMCAYDAKTQLRKMKASEIKKASATKVKSAKGKSKKVSATCNHATIDGVTELLKTIAKTQKDVAKLQVLRTEIVKVIAIIDCKMITTPTGQAFNKLVNA